MCFGDPFVVSSPEWKRCVSTWEKMVVYYVFARFGVWFRSEVIRFLEWHMAAITVCLGLFGVIKTSRSMTGNAAEQVGVVVILSSHPFFVFRQVVWKVDFMACAAKLGRFMHGLEHLAFVKGWLGLHKQHVDLLEQTIFTVSERVVLWFLYYVVAIAPVGLDFGDRMTDRAGDTRLACRVVYIVVVRVVEGATEEWNRIVATGAESRGVDIPVAFQRYFTGFSHGRQVCGVVE